MKMYDVIRTIVYTVITFLATVLLVIETPATGGYFNLGEAAIYSIACIAPPLVTAIAAGLGPALADLVLGYWYFAPATLVIKFSEGYIVSYLMRKLRSENGLSTRLRISTLIAGLTIAGLVIINAFGRGEEKLGLVFTWTETKIMGISIPIPNIVVYLPSYTWILIAVLIAAICCFIALKGVQPFVLSMAIGGIVMVTGYFLYEYFVSNPLILGRDPLGAIFEVPVNVGQFTAGILLASPVVRFVEKAAKTRRT